MLSAPRSHLQCYGMAVLVVVIATILMLILDPWVHMLQSPFLLYFGAVMVSAWYGGTRPGLISAVLSALISAYFFLSPTHSWLLNAPNTVRLVLFMLECVLISGLCGAMHRAQRRAQNNWRSLEISEVSLRVANTRISNILESITDGFFTLDQQWRCTYINRRCEEIVGRLRDTRLGQNIW
ncbi:MAG: DUF4118 domain-containing protein, partial [Microcystaceae cyanobacterium]